MIVSPPKRIFAYKKTKPLTKLNGSEIIAVQHSSCRAVDFFKTLNELGMICDAPGAACGEHADVEMELMNPQQGIYLSFLRKQKLLSSNCL